MNPVVFVIDDNPEMLELQSLVLRSEGFDVFTAKDGPEALRTLNEIPTPQLLILDVDLGEMSGPEFLEIAHEKFPPIADQVPVVFMTACNPPKNTRAVGCIDKMTDLDAYISAVHSYIDGSKDSNHGTTLH